MKKLPIWSVALLCATLLLLIAFCIFVVPAIHAEEEVDEPNTGYQMNADSYKNSVAAQLNAAYRAVIDGDEFLSEHYAGAFIDEDNNYNICVTSEEALAALKEAFADADVEQLKQSIMADSVWPDSVTSAAEDVQVVYHLYTYTYDYLYKIVEAVGPVMIDMEIYSAGVSQMNNVVQIKVSEETDQEGLLNYLRETLADFDPDAVQITIGEPLYAL